MRRTGGFFLHKGERHFPSSVARLGRLVVEGHLLDTPRDVVGIQRVLSMHQMMIYSYEKDGVERCKKSGLMDNQFNWVRPCDQRMLESWHVKSENNKPLILVSSDIGKLTADLGKPMHKSIFTVGLKGTTVVDNDANDNADLELTNLDDVFDSLACIISQASVVGQSVHSGLYHFPSTRITQVDNDYKSLCNA